MSWDLHETSQAIGKLQASVEKLESTIDRLNDKIEDLQKVRWLTVGGLIVLSGVSGAGGGWISKILHM